jgi:hypothetical protein
VRIQVHNLQRWFDGGDFISVVGLLVAIFAIGLPLWLQWKASKKATIQAHLVRIGQHTYVLVFLNVGGASAIDFRVRTIAGILGTQPPTEYDRASFPIPVFPAGSAIEVKVDFKTFEVKHRIVFTWIDGKGFHNRSKEVTSAEEPLKSPKFELSSPGRPNSKLCIS